MDYLGASTCYPLYSCARGAYSKMFVGRDASLYVFQEASSHGLESVTLPLVLPFCGFLHGKGILSVKDIFGLSRSVIGEEMTRRIIIKPALLPLRDTLPIQALDGMEEKSKHKESDTERYFMRDYIPGDRYRDINWKATSRFNELFTRISPVTQERTNVLSVIFRPYWNQTNETIRTLSHLNYVKSWLMLFLKSVKQMYPDYQFQLYLGERQRLLKTREDIDGFALDLSETFFQQTPPPFIGDPLTVGTGQIFVFTTSFDENLVRSLDPKSEVAIFTTAFPKKDQESNRVSVFQPETSFVLPGQWLFSGFFNRQSGGVTGRPGLRVIRDVLDVRLLPRSSNSREEAHR
jgi:hypothetical protein